MATRPARFEFQCEKDKLKFTHHIPQSLVSTDTNYARDPQYLNTFMGAIRPILDQHEPACRASSSKQCGQCGSPTAKILMTPMSWLHRVDDPFVNIYANPVCDKEPCEMKTRQQIQDLMALASGRDNGGIGADNTPGTTGTVELLPCRVCGKMENTARCGRCKYVAYCGKEHQKADWGLHKKACNSMGR